MGADASTEIQHISSGELLLQPQGVGDVVGAAEVPGGQLKQVAGAHARFIESFSLRGIEGAGVGGRQRIGGQGQAALQFGQLQTEVIRQLAAQIKASVEELIEGEGGGGGHGCSP